jgi:hypothetical protein
MLDVKIKNVCRLADAGTVALPPAVTALWAAHKRLAGEIRAEVEAAAPKSSVGVGSAAEDVVARLVAGRPVDFASLAETAIEASLAGQRFDAMKRVFDAALNQAERELESVLVEHADDAVRDLQLRLADLLDEVREVTKAMGDRERTGDAMLDAPKPIQQAYKRLPDLAGRYNRLKAAHRDLLMIRGGVNHAHLRRFGDVRDAGRLWAETDRPGVDPWPQDVRDLLLWSVDTEHVLWFPTVGELADAASHAPLKSEFPRSDFVVTMMGSD